MKNSEVNNTVKMNLFNDKIIGFNELRTNIGDVVGSVINKYQVVESGNVKKNNKETATIIASKVLEDILAIYEFNPKEQFDNETGQQEISLKEIGVSSFGETKSEAEEMLLDMVIDSTEEYFDNIELYMRIDKMKAQFPYFLRIKQCKDRSELKRVLNLVKN